MKKTIKYLLAVLLFAFVLVPFTKASAAVAPAAPTGLGLAGQNKTKYMLKWNFDSNVIYASENGYFGYEVVITTLKNKKIKTVDYNAQTNYSSNIAYDVEHITPNVIFVTTDFSTVYANVSNSKLEKQAFKYKVRAYTFDATGNKLYGEYSADKVIVPRPTITKLKATSKSTGKITWKKISGAKSYTVYVSTDGGNKFKKKGTTKSNSFTVKGMKLYTTYPVYVVANGVKFKKKKFNSTKPEVKTSNASTIKIYLSY